MHEYSGTCGAQGERIRKGQYCSNVCFDADGAQVDYIKLSCKWNSSENNIDIIDILISEVDR